MEQTRLSGGAQSNLIGNITSVCCYSELLQEPEKFKKSNPKEVANVYVLSMDVTYLGW